jgi:imidazole glycerol-phosphate synthase subunit HisH
MIALIDYGISNLRSVQKAFEHLGVEVTLVDTPEAAAQAERLILPGVGAFPAGMEGLRARGLIEPIKRAALSGKPLLGICLGMQLLFESSNEMGDTQGLGILPGQVKRMTGERLKIPHMGWNQLEPQRDHPIMRSVPSGAYAYFVHSYAVYPDQRDIILATTEYGAPFASVVGRDRICGLQFHPEKSQTVGLTLLKNFLEM